MMPTVVAAGLKSQFATVPQLNIVKSTRHHVRFSDFPSFKFLLF